MTTTTVPFEQTSIETDYFKIYSIEEFESVEKHYGTTNLPSYLKEFAEQVNGKYNKKASMIIYYNFGKKKIKSYYRVYFNDTEDVIASLRLYYAGKLEWLSDSNLAYFDYQNDY